MTDNDRPDAARRTPEALRDTPSGAFGDAPDVLRPSVAVVGSGPSGCYVASFLGKKWPGSQIIIFESMPTPYGLVRYGIAADHQGTKNVTRQFDRLFTKDGVHFAGNVCVGADLDFDELAAAFDIVVLATGLPEDRSLDIPIDPNARVMGAGTLLRALNGYPSHSVPRDSDGRCSALGEQLAVVGMGNVALDVVRLMSKDSHEFDGSDIDDELLEQLRPHRPGTIDVISRSGLALAKFDHAMLRELLSLPNIEVTVNGLSDSATGPAAELLRTHIDGGAASVTADAPRTHVRLHFQLTPDSVTTEGGRTCLRTSTPGGRDAQADFVVDTVITAIGFTQGPEHDPSSPTGHWSGDNVYRVGWLSRGPHGAIPENRKDARQVVERIAEDVASGRLRFGKPGHAAVEHLLRDVVTFADWQRIEAFEQSEALPGRCRRKVTDRTHMLSIATSTPSSGSRPDLAAVPPRPKETTVPHHTHQLPVRESDT
ncbi:MULTISPECIES: oxidoreductase [Nocardiaceae]|uniref:Ferredoxin--NADP+ reductase n=1 Tax=Rhodococcoides corynebacterioides TaxID=53972 RepID=A0ABS2KZL6_9NOCA|nr:MULTISPECIES: oxidoreductase [Rhodococcus]MBM7417367.1 ferredoxin--NADP+ reductase [Rhodococcus corynebacterioides]MBP1115621.1 ferredoxin--NADP+ reductase [Rhodococcus sp. PvP016]